MIPALVWRPNKYLMPWIEVRFVFIFPPSAWWKSFIWKRRIVAGLGAKLDRELRGGMSGLQWVDLSVDIVRVLPLIARSAVPDMPDRIIAATALHLNLPLLSKDRKIQVSGIQTIW